MAKDKTLEALLQLKRALSQGRDIASSALGRMIERVKDGDDLAPNAEYVRPARQPMQPMFTGQPAPEPEVEAKPKAKAKTTSKPEGENTPTPKAKSKDKSKPPEDEAA